MSDQTKLSTSEEYRVRSEKLRQIAAQYDEVVWPQVAQTNATCKEILDEFDDVEKQKREYTLAGRLIAIREHGKSIFAQLQDRSGQLQLYFKKDVIGDDLFEFLQKFIDVGDIVYCQGISFKTRMGEITLKVTSVRLLSKCLRPLPEKFHGLADVETKYRQRYLDLISNPLSRQRFLKRSKIIRLMRDFFDDHDFIEVETPMLHPIPGGAVARPFVTHHNALDMELFMRIAPELYLKRLVVGGFERVYEINRSFRNEGISTKHNPEFTMVEFYVAYRDYHFMMDFVEQMIKRLVLRVNGALHVQFGEHMLDFESPFVRISMLDAVKQHGSLTDADLDEQNIDQTIKRLKLKIDDKYPSWGHKLFYLFEELVEDKLIQPTFIIDFPVEVSPLSKRLDDNQKITGRFELSIAGMELVNGFNELNDPVDQAKRFKAQAEIRTAGDDEAHYYDDDYITALEYALPPTVGAGIGIDRLVMLLTNTTSIKDVILFPTLKQKKN